MSVFACLDLSTNEPPLSDSSFSYGVDRLMLIVLTGTLPVRLQIKIDGRSLSPVCGSIVTMSHDLSVCTIHTQCMVSFVAIVD